MARRRRGEAEIPQEQLQEPEEQLREPVEQDMLSAAGPEERRLPPGAAGQTLEEPPAEGYITSEPERMPAFRGIIGKEQIDRADARLRKFMQGKQQLQQRVISDEQWWRLKGWDEMVSKSENEYDPRPASAWMFNSIINKHADFMDNFPDANILPQEESDKNTAVILSEVIPVINKQNGFTDCYSKEVYDKVKFGTGIYGVFWDVSAHNGLGDVKVRPVDVLKLYWEPGVEDPEASRDMFFVDLVDTDILKATYPQLKDIGKGSWQGYDAKYVYEDEIDTTEKTVVVDWYYKKTIRIDSGNPMDIPVIKTVLHYVKYCEGILLYASENDPNMAEGFYAHGRYPFVFDVMFPMKGSPAGFGYIDIMRDPQMYIDKLDQAILKNAVMKAKPRYLSKDGGGINEDEFGDLSKDIVHYTGDPNALAPILTPDLPAIAVQVRQNKIDELKETSGNRDFSQGATASGVTAASAIAALQEAGSKLSRDMIKGSYSAFERVIYLEIELIRQFYTVPRVYRIMGESGEMRFRSIDNRLLAGEKVVNEFGVMTGGRKPYFDIDIAPQKASPFSKVAQNEFAKELYGAGFFNPEMVDQALMCLDMMSFDGKEELKTKISQQGTLYDRYMNLQKTAIKIADLLAQTTGDSRLSNALRAAAGVSMPGMPQQPMTAGETVTDSLGNIQNKAENSTAGKARARVAEAASPRS